MSLPPAIVIIDDDEAVRIAAESLARSLGFGIKSFASAEDFIGSPIFGNTACVITDVQLPGMSGVELQTHLKARGDLTPLIFITAFPDERIRQEVTAAGAFGFLGKPFDGSALIECIDRALRARAAPKEG